MSKQWWLSKSNMCCFIELGNVGQQLLTNVQMLQSVTGCNNILFFSTEHRVVYHKYVWS